MNIYFSKTHNKYHARKQEDGKTQHIGYFDTLDEAQEAIYDFTEETDYPEFIPPKVVRSEYEGKSIEWLQERSKQQIKELTLKYGPKPAGGL